MSFSQIVHNINKIILREKIIMTSYFHNGYEKRHTKDSMDIQASRGSGFVFDKICIYPPRIQKFEKARV